MLEEFDCQIPSPFSLSFSLTLFFFLMMCCLLWTLSKTFKVISTSLLLFPGVLAAALCLRREHITWPTGLQAAPGPTLLWRPHRIIQPPSQAC